MEALEKKIDTGFAEMRADSVRVREQIVSTERALRSEIAAVRSEVFAVRSDGRADFRTLIAVVFAMWVATLLAIVGVLAGHV